MPPDHDALVGAIGRLEQVAETLTGEVANLRTFKDSVLLKCVEHSKDIDVLKTLSERISTRLIVGDEWMRDRDLERAAFHGGWKFAILMSSIISGGVALLASIKGMM